MNPIRRHFFSKFLAFIAGMALLNMSFLLAEVTMLKLEKGSLQENFANLIINTGFEEERDGESSTENPAKALHLLIQQVQIHFNCSRTISVNINRMVINHYRHANHSLTFSPPPDIQHFS